MTPRTLTTAAGAALLAAMASATAVVAAPASTPGRGEIHVQRTALYKDVAGDGAGSMMVRSSVRYRHAVPAARRGTWFAVTETRLRGPGGTVVVRDADVVRRVHRGQLVDHNVVLHPDQVEHLEGPGADPSTLRATTRSYLVQARYASNALGEGRGRAVAVAQEWAVAPVVPTHSYPRTDLVTYEDGPVSITLGAGYHEPFPLSIRAIVVYRERGTAQFPHGTVGVSIVPPRVDGKVVDFPVPANGRFAFTGEAHAFIAMGMRSAPGARASGTVPPLDDTGWVGPGNATLKWKIPAFEDISAASGSVTLTR